LQINVVLRVSVQGGASRQVAVIVTGVPQEHFDVSDAVHVLPLITAKTWLGAMPEQATSTKMDWLVQLATVPLREIWVGPAALLPPAGTTTSDAGLIEMVHMDVHLDDEASSYGMDGDQDSHPTLSTSRDYCISMDGLSRRVKREPYSIWLARFASAERSPFSRLTCA
jgi:hypothetical protein